MNEANKFHCGKIVAKKVVGGLLALSMTLSLVPSDFVLVAKAATQEMNEKNTVESPVVNEDRSVTFNYIDSDNTLAVSVAGNFNGWGDAIGKDVMELKDAENGIWSKTIEGFAPGVYAYKLVLGEDGWQVDPLSALTDADGNSAFAVPGIAFKDKLQAEKGKTLTLPETVNLYEKGTLQPKEVNAEFALKDDTVKGVSFNAKDRVLEVTDEYTDSQIVLTATANGYTNDVSVEVVDKMYQYTIHYYSAEQKYDETDLWIWETSGKAYNKGFEFNQELSEDAVGRTWTTAVYSFPTTSVNIIARSKDAWDWQEETKTVAIPEGQESAEVWLVKGNPLVFTEWAEEFPEPEKRYVLIEYDRPANDYELWNAYTWNSGANSSLNVSNYFEEKSGKHMAVIEIGEQTASIGFWIRKGEPTDEEDWTKDIDGRRRIVTPLDQKVVKVKATQGVVALDTVPYNTGCELNVNDNQMNFYYRDDELFMNGAMDEIKSVQVEVDGIMYDMTYNAEDERYEYVMKNVKEKTYEYRFFVTDKDGNVKETVDLFNDKTTEDGTKSVIEYKDIDVKVTGTVNAAFDYNENAVLSVKAELVGEEAKTVSPDAPAENGLVVKECYADLTALGGKEKTPIETELMELSIGVSDKVTAGEKQIPITVVDQYGKRHVGEATATIKPRTVADEGDFDWDEAVVYFLSTDRFYDGDPSNNDAYGVGDYNNGENGNSSYHGGDFVGITEKLDYIKGLGVNTIWITPVVENILEDQHAVSVKDGYDMPTYGYHGYWASSFERLNKHLGTIEEFHTLIDEAHARGMKIMVDIVMNHSGYGTDTSDEFKGMFRDKNVEGNEILGQVSGMPDFATERPEVREKLVQWQTNWVSEIAVTEKGNTIDYFRVDAVKYAESTSWAALKNSLTKVAPTFKLIGEYTGAGYVDDFGTLNSGQMDSLSDFEFTQLALKFAKGSFDHTEKEMETRNANMNNVATLGNFLSAHDVDGFKYLLKRAGYEEEEAQKMTNIAATLQFTAKGQPILYYGEEIGFSGGCNWPYQDNRRNMQFDNLSAEQQKIMTHYKKLIKARVDYSKTFAKGTRSKVAGNDQDGYLVFKRSYDNGETNQDIFVGINRTEKEQKVAINLSTGMVVSPETPAASASSSSYVDVYSGETVAVNNNVIVMTIPAFSEGGTSIIPVTTKSVQDVTPTKVPTVEPTKTPAVTTYDIKYVLNKGQNNKSNPKTYSTKDVKLKNPTRKGYTFSGWYTDSKFKNKVTTIKASTKANVTVYAKWTKVTKPAKVTVKKVTNVKGSKINVTLKKVSAVKGYEIKYTTDKKFKKSVKTTTSTKTVKTISKLKKNKTYYVKARAYKIDSTGNKVYGSYSKVVKIVIKK